MSKWLTRKIDRARYLPGLAWLYVLIFIQRARGRKILFFSARAPSLVQYFAPIIAELKKRDTSLAYFYGIDFSYGRSAYDLDIVGGNAIPYDLAKFVRGVDVYLNPSLDRNGPPGAVRIYIAHNQPVKLEGYPAATLLNYPVHFLLGPLQRTFYEQMPSLQDGSLKALRLVEVGYPKSDRLIRGTLDRDTELERLGLNPACFTLLYAPTWEEGASLRSYGVALAEALLALPDTNVLVKLHPVSLTPPGATNYQQFTGSINWAKEFEILQSNPRFRFIRDPVADPYLAAADMMVTDISSVALEFIPLNRPVVYLDCPAYMDCMLRHFPWAGKTSPDTVRNNPTANAGRHVGVVAHNLDELVDAIQRERVQPGQGAAARRKFADDLLYNPGHGAERAADEILALLADTKRIQ